MENNCSFAFATYYFILSQITMIRKGSQIYIKSWRRRKEKFLSETEEQGKAGHGQSE
jgi:hypothetical protein